MRAKLRVGVAIFLASVAFQATFIALDAFVSDEGIVLVAADDVANGRLLYRDINVPLTPAVYLIQGLAFALFGSHFLLSRILVCAVDAACALMVFELAATFLPLRRAALAGALAIPLQVWMWPHAQYFSYNQLTVLLCLVALRCAWTLETTGTRRSAFVFGTVLAAGLWTKPNLPVATGAGVLLYWLSAFFRTRLGWPCPRPRDFGRLFGEGLATLAGIAAASIPMILYLSAAGILDDMIAGVVAISRVYSDSPGGLFPGPLPLTGQIDAVRLSTGLVLPGMLINVFHGIGRDPFYYHLVLFTGWVDLFVRALYYVPVLLYAATALALARCLRGGAWSRESEAALLVCSGGLLLYASNISFPSLHYITPTLLPLVALSVFAASAWSASLRAGWRRRSLRFAIRASVAIYLSLSLAAVASYLAVPRSPVHTARGTLWVHSPTAVLWNDILEYTDRVMQPGDEIFAVPYFPLFYFMSGRDHPSRFVALGPGLPGTEAEDEIIGLLESKRVAYALDVYGAEYPGLEKFQNAYPRLHHYLETQYELERRFVGASRDYADLLRRKTPDRASAPAETAPAS